MIAYRRSIQPLARQILGKEKKGLRIKVTQIPGEQGELRREVKVTEYLKERAKDQAYFERDARESKDRAGPYVESFPSTLFRNPAC